MQVANELKKLKIRWQLRDITYTDICWHSFEHFTIYNATTDERFVMNASYIACSKTINSWIAN